MIWAACKPGGLFSKESCDEADRYLSIIVSGLFYELTQGLIFCNLAMEMPPGVYTHISGTILFQQISQVNYIKLNKRRL